MNGDGSNCSSACLIEDTQHVLHRTLDASAAHRTRVVEREGDVLGDRRRQREVRNWRGGTGDDIAMSDGSRTGRGDEQ
jgi:hypothetical protein